MNAKTAHSSVTKQTKAHEQSTAVSPDVVVHQLNEDVRNSVLVVSVLINLFVLISWLVIQVSSRYDAALIHYIQTK